MKNKDIPEKFLQQFEIKDYDFYTDAFEEMILRDVYRFDKETLEKIKRDITDTFINWIIGKLSKKENVSINIKGDTRGGKSLGGLSVVEFIISYYLTINMEKKFDTEKIVCGNQKEYRQKLKDVDFGDVFQIDENAFANVGIGSATEMMQLKDVQNIIAKKNIHTIYITPRSFLETNATLGLSLFGKDTKNWLTRFLVYDLRKKHTPLLGFIIIDVGKLFRKYGCYIYKEIGGCTNPSKKTLKQIPDDHKKYSFCIPEKYDNSLIINDGKSCPFYKICTHPLCKYEHKKDTWIAKEMEGGMDERVSERYETALKLMQKLSMYDASNNRFSLKARDGKQLKIKINLYIGEVTNTKYTQGEVDEFIVLLKSLCDMDFFRETCKQLKLNFEEEVGKIPTE